MGLNYDEIDKDIDRDLGIVVKREHPQLKALWHWTKKLLHPFWLLLKGIYYVLRFPVIPALSIANYNTSEGQRIGKVPMYRRIIEGLLTRVILTPFIVGAFLLLLVWYTTHPSQILASQSPTAVGLSFRPVSLESSDGQRLQAWYIPGITTSEVVRNGDEALLQKRPAAILIHGLGYGQDQYLPLAARLHEAGFSVLMLSLRGQGENATGKHAGVTFGLREKLDVLAAVGYLREISHVDSSRIAVVGYGMGANAALQAALLDHSIAAVVVENPWPTFEDWTKHNFDVPYVPTNLMSALYQTTFELAYRERVSQLDMGSNLRYLRQTSVFMILHNQQDGVPVAPLLNAAATISGPHRELVLEQDDPRATAAALAGTITAELAETMHWVPAQERLSESLKKMYESRIK